MVACGALLHLRAGKVCFAGLLCWLVALIRRLGRSSLVSVKVLHADSGWGFRTLCPRSPYLKCIHQRKNK